MEYRGDIYGKFAGKYIKMAETSEEFESRIRAEAMQEAATFDELKESLIKHSDEWKSEYIQAAIVMLRVIYEERKAILNEEAEK